MISRGRKSTLRIPLRGRPGRSAFKRYGDAKGQIINLIRYYEKKIMPKNSPTIRIIFTKNLPYDVLGEMQPYYDVRTNKVVRIELRLNSDFISRNLDQISLGDVRGLIAHEMCHAKHCVSDFADYMAQKNTHADLDYYKPCMRCLNASKYRRGTHPGLVVKRKK